jgi:ABC-2 type transport system permease protein
MRKTFIVAKHEFLATVKTKGFIFSLILPLLILLLMVFAMGFIPQTISESPQNIGFVDETGTLQTSEDFIKFGDIGNAKKALLENEINSFFVLPANYLETGKISVYSMGGFFSSRPTSSIEVFLMDNLLRESDLDENVKERIKVPANEEVITLNEKGEVEEKQWRFCSPLCLQTNCSAVKF